MLEFHGCAFGEAMDSGVAGNTMKNNVEGGQRASSFESLSASFLLVDSDYLAVPLNSNSLAIKGFQRSAGNSTRWHLSCSVAVSLR